MGSSEQAWTSKAWTSVKGLGSPGVGGGRVEGLPWEKSLLGDLYVNTAALGTLLGSFPLFFTSFLTLIPLSPFPSLGYIHPIFLLPTLSLLPSAHNSSFLPCCCLLFHSVSL